MLIIDRTKVHARHEVDSEGSWAISYGDMITLLLAFFVLFFTVDPEKERSDELQQSLIMNLTSGDTTSPNRKIDENLNIGKDPGLGSEERLLQNWSAEVYKVGHKIIVDFPGVSFYKLGYINMTDEGAKVLQEFAKRYMPYAGKYELGIRAFTDSRPVKNKTVFRDNLELSALRSVSAMRILRDAGIPLDRMKLGGYGELTVTYGDLMSVKPESDKDTQAVARRVVLVIEPEMVKEIRL